MAKKQVNNTACFKLISMETWEQLARTLSLSQKTRKMFWEQRERNFDAKTVAFKKHQAAAAASEQTDHINMNVYSLPLVNLSELNHVCKVYSFPNWLSGWLKDNSVAINWSTESLLRLLLVIQQSQRSAAGDALKLRSFAVVTRQRRITLSVKQFISGHWKPNLPTRFRWHE